MGHLGASVMTAGGDSIDWIGIDWGGSDWNVADACAFAVSSDGTLIETAQAENTADTDTAEARITGLIGGWLPSGGRIPVITCGGSDMPARRLPCPPLEPDHLRQKRMAEPRIAFYPIPGLRQDRPADTVQGAETRIAGYLAGHADFDGVLCLTGPRSTWARISAGEVVGLVSFLTGEMFSLLAERSSLRAVVAKDAGHDGAAFGAALDDVLSRPERLAGVIAAIGQAATGQAAAGAARARLSGALIGAELAAARAWWLGQAVAVIGGPETVPLYQAALARQGISAPVADGRKMALAGLARARAVLRARPST